MANICFTTVPLVIVLVMNIILYGLTWQKIGSETKRLRETLGDKPASVRASHRAAKAMSLFVAAFFIQWWALTVYGVWALVGTVPEEWFYLLITFDNLGGVLNLGVYIIIRKKNLTQGEKGSTAEDNVNSSKTCESRLSDIGRQASQASLDQSSVPKI